MITIQIVLIILKLFKLINIDWLFVFLPIIIWFGLKVIIEIIKQLIFN
nr:MAG TPA: hypothetical protein [Caudoviricetes sp.]